MARQGLINQRSKYGISQSPLAKLRRVYKGQRYASGAELSYAMRLDLLQRAGEIEAWCRPEPLEISVNLQPVCKYQPDFCIKRGARREYHEIKGYTGGCPAALSLLKFKLARACNPLDRFRWFQAVHEKGGWQFVEKLL
jgi:hypothetical protein